MAIHPKDADEFSRLIRNNPGVSDARTALALERIADYLEIIADKMCRLADGSYSRGAESELEGKKRHR